MTNFSCKIASKFVFSPYSIFLSFNRLIKVLSMIKTKEEDNELVDYNSRRKSQLVHGLFFNNGMNSSLKQVEIFQYGINS
jgi:hypothetical protein